MFKQNTMKRVLLLGVIAVFWLSIPTAVLAGGGQTCTEPNCGSGGYGIPAKLLQKLQVNHGLTTPKGLRNPALLNLEPGSAPPEILFNSAFKIGGSAVTQIGGTAVDSDGNFYVSGGFTGTITFGAESLTSSKGYDFYLAKYDRTGTFLWARAAQGMLALADQLAIEGGIAITVDKAGDCYVGGAFVNSMFFLDRTGNIVTELTDGRNDDTINFEMFIAKYSSSGALLWARGGNSGGSGGVDFLGTDVNVVTSLVLDSEDYPYIGGRYSGSDFLGESVRPQGKSDFFIASLEKDTGNPFWVRLVGTPEDDAALSLSVDSLGFINALGSIGEGELALPDTTGIYTNDIGSSDTFVMSWDVNGEWYFISLIGGGEIVTGNDVASDPEGNIYVTGHFSGTASFVNSDITLTANGDFVDGYIVKYDLNGNTLWARRFGGEFFAKGSRIVVDESGNSYVVGLFAETVAFAEESGNPVVLTANALTDMFIVKYDTDGNFEWVKQIDGSGTESLDLIASEQVPVGTNPVQLLYNSGELLISGDFNDMLFLDDLELDSGENSRSGFVATIDLSGTTTSVAAGPSSVTTDFSLAQNFPNPFNPATTLKFTLAREEHVAIDIFNSLGQRIETLVNTKLAHGSHEVVWDASGQPSGSYFYTLQAGQFIETKKMVFVK